MRLSSRAIELCRTKLGKGDLCGLQEGPALDGISEESARQLLEELTRDGTILLSEDGVRISPLGQHIFRMMLEPEQYIMVDRTAGSARVRIYIRDAYYLCVVEDKTVTSEDDHGRYTLRLLPRLELVVGSFAYVLQHDGTHAPEEAQDGQQAGPDILVVGKAWDRDRASAAELTIRGDFHGEDIRCQAAEGSGDPEEFECGPSELVNRITGWMFKNFSAADQSEVH